MIRSIVMTKDNIIFKQFPLIILQSKRIFTLSQRRKILQYKLTAMQYIFKNQLYLKLDKIFI